VHSTHPCGRHGIKVSTLDAVSKQSGRQRRVSKSERGVGQRRAADKPSIMVVSRRPTRQKTAHRRYTKLLLNQRRLRPSRHAMYNDGTQTWPHADRTNQGTLDVTDRSAIYRPIAKPPNLFLLLLLPLLQLRVETYPAGRAKARRAGPGRSDSRVMGGLAHSSCQSRPSYPLND